MPNLKQQFARALKTTLTKIFGVVRKVCGLPQAIVAGSRFRREQSVIDREEAERLDRLRNPSKYIGR